MNIFLWVETRRNRPIKLNKKKPRTEAANSMATFSNERSLYRGFFEKKFPKK